MKRVSLIPLIVVSALVWSTMTADATQKRVAVLELANRAEITDDEANYLTDLVRGAASRTLPRESFLVITRENIYELLPQDMDLSKCTEAKCEVEIGRRIGVDFLVTGEVIQFGGELRVILKLYETSSASLLESIDLGGVSVNELEIPLKEKGRELFGAMLTKDQDAVRPQGELKTLQAERKRLEEKQKLAMETQKDEKPSSTHKSGEIWTDPFTGMEFVWVPEECFQMGDTFGDGEICEKPVHEVCVNGFWIGKYEVTQGQWKKVMGSNPSHFPDCGDDCPVEIVSWKDTQEFIRRLNRETGQNYRLPTEAEWEYAARSGGRKEKYSGGSNLDSVAWYNDNSGKKTHPVGEKAPNGLGLYDLTGNVWEWCGDRYDKGYYSKSSGNNPTGPSSGSRRVLRGGSWDDLARYLRVSYRYRSVPVFRNYNIGFRCAQDFQ
ncbi:SUMF1/EgtB/PvdO family nonheme iron enzyme [Thermodesulfobacteriota bacterium]